MRRCGCSAHLPAVRFSSDIDVAILPRDELPSSFFSDLAERVEESSIPYDVEIVDLRRAGPNLIDEVRREGLKWKG